MVTNKEKKIYISPHVRITCLDPEGLLCGSIKIEGTVQDWENIETKGSDWVSPVIES